MLLSFPPNSGKKSQTFPPFHKIPNKTFWFVVSSSTSLCLLQTVVSQSTFQIMVKSVCSSEVRLKCIRFLLNFVGEKHDAIEICSEMFEVSQSTVYSWLKQFKDSGKCGPKIERNKSLPVIEKTVHFDWLLHEILPIVSKLGTSPTLSFKLNRIALSNSSMSIENITFFWQLMNAKDWI